MIASLSTVPAAVSAAGPVIEREPDEIELDQYLTFGLGNEMFAVSVQHVREVLDYRSVSPLANGPAILLGMIDLRGTAIPIVDLRRKLGLSSADEGGEHTRIVVMEIGCDERRLVVGAITDAVYEVAHLPETSTEPPPDIGQPWDATHMRGLARRGDRFVTILDLDRLFGTDDVGASAPLL
jgi:purine-binding chemotaxis protein CheW